MTVAKAPRRRREEAGTDEVVALATLLVPVPHIPGPRASEEDADVTDVPDAAAAFPEPPAAHTLPLQPGEFTCRRCRLVMHVSSRVGDVCRDCL